ncbi:MAG: rhomboid family intramembrane serine protease [Acidobacteriota bacterium]|nr:rhomboid family intramembrane serine protease [Acidobacteriota bacterium]
MSPYRQVAFSFGPPLTPMVKKLVIITSAAFVLTYIPAQIFGVRFLEFFDYLSWFGLRPDLVVHRLFVWQLVTYLFLHGGWFHIIFNMFALWMFGSDLESLWGGKKFLTFYFVAGVGAGILDVTLNTLFRPAGPSVTIGCSGAVYGLLLAYGMLFPERLIYLYMIIPIKAKWFVAIMGAIEFVSSFSDLGSGVSHVAHLGGMLFGYIYLRGWALPYRLQLQYHDWRRAQLRKKFEVYMRDQEKKGKHGRWVN